MRMFSSALVLLALAQSVRADLNTIGPLGIESQGLPLNGSGELIGQVEPGRPGKPGKDMATWYHSQVQPEQVYAGSVVDAANSVFVQGEDGEHATEVASVMIGRSTKFDGTPGNAGLVGVAPAAVLHAAAMSSGANDNSFGVAANRIARIPRMRAINVSAGRELTDTEAANGNARITQIVDWSGAIHDVLYVIAGAEVSSPGDVPDDNFNGITVAASQTLNGSVAGRYVQVWPDNVNLNDAEGSRTSIDLMAPGFQIEVGSPGEVASTVDGTSLAAPHVIGTVALLQQYATTRIQLGTPRWDDTSARRHEVMKAILLNSADKLQGIHRSGRTIVNKPEEGAQNWLTTMAYSDPFTSLDSRMGAGHLNASSAFTNFKTGEYEEGTVSPIGWDYGFIGAGLQNDYVFDQAVSGYVAITLAWDREWAKTGDEDSFASEDQFFNSSLNDLDVYLLDANSNDIFNPVRSSTTNDDNLEHIFFEVPQGSYKIKVVHADGDNDQEYGIAWWAGETTATTPGDFDEDGDVDGDDLDDWKTNFGAGPGADADGDGDSDGADFLAWQQNYGTTSAAIVTAAVPEPAALTLVAVGLPLLARRRSC